MKNKIIGVDFSELTDVEARWFLYGFSACKRGEIIPSLEKRDKEIHEELLK